jgi:hypothetical protein
MSENFFTIPFGYHTEAEVLERAPAVIPHSKVLCIIALLRKQYSAEWKLVFKGDEPDQNVYAYSPSFLAVATNEFIDKQYWIARHASPSEFKPVAAVAKQLHTTQKKLKECVEETFGLENTLLMINSKQFLIHENLVILLAPLFKADEELYELHTGAELYKHGRWIKPKPTLDAYDNVFAFN